MESGQENLYVNICPKMFDFIGIPHLSKLGKLLQNIVIVAICCFICYDYLKILLLTFLGQYFNNCRKTKQNMILILITQFDVARDKINFKSELLQSYCTYFLQSVFMAPHWYSQAIGNVCVRKELISQRREELQYGRRA